MNGGWDDRDDDRSAAAGGQPAGRPLPSHLDPRRGRGSSVGSRSGASATSTRSGRSGGAAGRRTLFIGTRVIAGLLSLVLLGTTGWGWYLTQVAEQNLNRSDAIPTQGNENLGGGDAEAVNILLVGNDNRTSLSPEDLARLGVSLEPGLNTDTMILLHIPADGTRASFVSFPRDSYVEVPGFGEHKLNAAYSLGYNEVAPEGSDDPTRDRFGMELLIQTISALSGLQVDHFVSIDLLGFFNLSELVGGVPINLCEAQQEEKSGIDLPAGPQRIAGAQALAFVRQRDGVPGGDLGRIARQQVFIGALLNELLSQEVLFDFGRQTELINAASQSLTVDTELDLFTLIEQVQAITAGSITFQTMPNEGIGTGDDGASIIVPADRDTLFQFFANLTADGSGGNGGEQAPEPVEPAAPADTEVFVYNGSGEAGIASTTGDELTAAGFVLDGTGNADTSDYTVTEIRFAEGQEAQAAAVAAAIPGVVPRLDPTVTDPVVQLVIGTDFNGIGQQVDPASAPDPAADPEAPPRTAADTSCIN